MRLTLLVLNLLLSNTFSRDVFIAPQFLYKKSEEKSAFLSRHVARHVSLSALLRTLGARRGVELGVQRGIFSTELLLRWPEFEEYNLVDMWGSADFIYRDGSARSDEEGSKILADAFDRLKTNVLGGFTSKIEFLLNETNSSSSRKTFSKNEKRIRACRDLTSKCVKHFEDESLDFIYVDARHDYNGVQEDLELWYRKLSKMNGVIAGHDMITAAEHRLHTRNYDDQYEVNFDGSFDTTGRAVKGAVNDFFGLLGKRLIPIDQYTEHRSWLVLPEVSEFSANKKIPEVLHVFFSNGFPSDFCGKSVLGMNWERQIDVLERLHPDWPIVFWTPKLLLEKWEELFPT